MDAPPHLWGNRAPGKSHGNNQRLLKSGPEGKKGKYPLSHWSELYSEHRVDTSPWNPSSSRERTPEICYHLLARDYGPSQLVHGFWKTLSVSLANMQKIMGCCLPMFFVQNGCSPLPCVYVGVRPLLAQLEENCRLMRQIYSLQNKI